jgi:hypothetical protein
LPGYAATFQAPTGNARCERESRIERRLAPPRPRLQTTSKKRTCATLAKSSSIGRTFAAANRR